MMQLSEDRVADSVAFRLPVVKWKASNNGALSRAVDKGQWCRDVARGFLMEQGHAKVESNGQGREVTWRVIGERGSEVAQ